MTAIPIINVGDSGHLSMFLFFVLLSVVFNNLETQIADFYNLKVHPKSS